MSKMIMIGLEVYIAGSMYLSLCIELGLHQMNKCSMGNSEITFEFENYSPSMCGHSLLANYNGKHWDCFFQQQRSKNSNSNWNISCVYDAISADLSRSF